ncbi:hypothetical protein AC578_9082 [Pseudocercospora eumusae]|uniref:Methyltransferase type 11 domain-containing protein n=1 Tax=Pseudocercospora eumusae TaxID=321146 RepID=A0A139H4V7_9PEZI|nr:hypothetical protein AC578_9082 [Pseudocercospora eumusae]
MSTRKSSWKRVWSPPSLFPKAKSVSTSDSRVPFSHNLPSAINMPPESQDKSPTGGAKYEQEHVHEVYEKIASHFSSTRYKVIPPSSIPPPHHILINTPSLQPWPIIERFLQNLPPGSIGLDIGCGNGKYLTVNPNVFMLGSDRSSNLISIAKHHQPHSVLLADILHLPHRASTFDFAISIAVVHHLSTPERRIEAVREILKTLKPDAAAGRALVYVWALEQDGSRRGWSEKDDQDVMVPWVMRGSKKGKNGDSSGAGTEDRTFHRYYHLYRKGELEHDIRAAGGEVVESGYEKDNWWAIATRTSP